MNISIPAEAQRAAERGDLIDAIKITRQQTGLGLKEAKDAIEAWLHGRNAASPAATGIPLNAILSLQEGNKVEAIRQTREASGRGLKESKDAVEAYLSANPVAQEQYRAKQHGGGWRRLLMTLVLLIPAAYVAWRLLSDHSK